MIEERRANSPDKPSKIKERTGSPSPKIKERTGSASPKMKERAGHVSPKAKEKERARENVWEARRNEALLDASNIERGILKDILFSETIKKACGGDSSITRSGPVYKEILSPRPVSPRPQLNDLTLPDSEVENNSPRDMRKEKRDMRQDMRGRCVTPEKRDMSSSYKEDDFRSPVHRGREDKSINTSPVRWDTPPARRDTTPRASPSRPRSPKKLSQKKRNSEDTLDTISDLESRYCEPDMVLRPGSPKKVSFSEDTADRNLKIHRLERDVQSRVSF